MIWHFGAETDLFNFQCTDIEMTEPIVQGRQESFNFIYIQVNIFNLRHTKHTYEQPHTHGISMKGVRVN